MPFSPIPFSIDGVLALPAEGPPVLTVVVDTEEEFDWNAPFDPGAVETRNIACQPLAQAIFDRHGLVPTYVIDYPVASSPAARDVLGPLRAAGRCEIGAHLHPWVNPPHAGPVDNVHSFPGNLPPMLERAKLAELAGCIEQGFGHAPAIYKAGRYGVGPATAGILADLGFRIDASIVPYTDFRPIHGPDFSAYADRPFRTAEGIIALPLTVSFVGALAAGGPRLYPWIGGRLPARLRIPGICARLKLLERLRLTPEGHGFDDMARQTRAALARGQRLFMLTYHSSSLLPGATSYVRDESGRQTFLSVLERYLAFFMGDCGGRPASLTEVADGLAPRCGGGRGEPGVKG